MIQKLDEENLYGVQAKFSAACAGWFTVNEASDIIRLVDSGGQIPVYTALMVRSFQVSK